MAMCCTHYSVDFFRSVFGSRLSAFCLLPFAFFVGIRRPVHPFSYTSLNAPRPSEVSLRRARVSETARPLPPTAYPRKRAGRARRIRSQVGHQSFIEQLS